MTNDTEKGRAREWWVPSEVLDPHFGSALPLEPPLIHVIEKSYATALENDVKALSAEIKRLCALIKGGESIAVEQIAKERDAARAEAEKLKSKLTSVTADYKETHDAYLDALEAEDVIAEQKALLDMAVVALEETMGCLASGLAPFNSNQIAKERDTRATVVHALDKIKAARKV